MFPQSVHSPLPRPTQFQVELDRLCDRYTDMSPKDMLRALTNKINEIEKV